jgi:hypothetical protein
VEFLNKNIQQCLVVEPVLKASATL